MLIENQAQLKHKMELCMILTKIQLENQNVGDGLLFQSVFLKRQNYEDEVIHNRVSDFGRTVNLNQKKKKKIRKQILYRFGYLFNFSIYSFWIQK